MVRLDARVDCMLKAPKVLPIACHLPAKATDARHRDVTDGTRVIRDNAWDDYRRFAEGLWVHGLPERQRARGDLSGEMVARFSRGSHAGLGAGRMDSHDLH